MKIVIVLLFIVSTIRGIKAALFEWGLNSESEKSITEFIQFGIENGYFIPSLILLIPMIGIFLNNRIGWFLIISYLYFIIIRIAFSIISELNEELNNISVILIGLLIITAFLALMNLPKISETIYAVRKKNLIWNNMAGTTIGIIINLIIK